MREAGLELPETPEEQFRWLLGDVASAYRFAPLYALGRLRKETPTDAWVQACLRAIERRAPQAVLAMDLLGAWRAKEAIPALVALLGDRDDAGLADSALEALVAIGDPALDAVLDRLGTSEDPELLSDCLEVCRRLPSRRAVEAICRRFESLFVLVPDELMECVETIGARELVEPLGGELREGEPAAEAAFLLLCEIHGIADPRLSGIREREAARMRLAEKAVREPEDAPRDHLILPLQCTACRRTYRYAVREVYVDPEVPEGNACSPSSATASDARAAAGGRVRPDAAGRLGAPGRNDHDAGQGKDRRIAGARDGSAACRETGTVRRAPDESPRGAAALRDAIG
jgi:hypothetical protein